MTTFLLATVLSLSILAGSKPVNESSSNDSDEHTWYNTDDGNSTEYYNYEYGGGGCPFLTAENKTGFGTVVACSHNCDGIMETLQDGTRCFVIGDEVLQRMTPNLPYSCPLGVCSKGNCVPANKYEVCYRRNFEKRKKEKE